MRPSRFAARDYYRQPRSTPGFCHYTVTGTTARPPRPRAAGSLSANPPALHDPVGQQPVRWRRNGSVDAADRYAYPSGGTTFTANGASVLFTTSAGTLPTALPRNQRDCQTNSSGVASVTLTLPSTPGSVTVTPRISSHGRPTGHLHRNRQLIAARWPALHGAEVPWRTHAEWTRVKER